MTINPLPKIAVVSLSISRDAGGLFFSVRHLSRELKKIGDFDITVLGLVDKNTIIDLPEWEGLNVKVFKRSLPGKFGFSLGLIMHLLREPYDLIHLHGIWNFSSLAVRLTYYLKKVPYIISPRGMLDPWILNKSKYKKNFFWWINEKELIKNATYIHALNVSEQKSIDSLAVAKDIITIPNGITHIPPIKRSWNKNRKILLFIGRIDTKKGLLEFITHWATIKNHNGWFVEIYGWGDIDYKKKLDFYIKNNNVKNIKIGGPVYGNEKKELLKNADAFFLPSFSEGLPMAVLEAWAFGLPALLTDFCNLPEGFNSNAATKLDLNADSYTDSLSKFIFLDEGILELMSNNAISLVERSFKWKKIASSMNKVYKNSLTLH